MRGESALDANDMERLAAGLSIHPHEISRLASTLYEESDEAITLVDRSVLAERLTRIVGCPSASGEDFSTSVLLALLTDRGILVTPAEWESYLNASETGAVRTRVLEVVADYAGFPLAYLLDPTDEDAADAADAMIEFRQAIRASGRFAILKSGR